MKRYYLITYGCLMNHSDSERIASRLENAGYSPTSDESKADLVVINVCSVRQRAIDRVVGKIKNFAKLKVKNKKLKVILTGCILEKDKKKLKKQVDEIWPTTNLEIKPHCHNKFSAYLPVMTGCDNFCSYCVVPYVRGREYSKPAKEIIEEVKDLIKEGYKEITLLGQNVNSYRGNLKAQISKVKTTTQKSKPEVIDFPKLLKMVNDIEGNFWLRFVTSHPKDMSDRLIDAVANYEKVCQYIHLPIQSGDDKILEKMNRGYTAKEYLGLVKKIRTKIPNAAISTDAIVGFPGETKKQFENTAKLFKKVGFDMAYIAQYSPRAETAAAKLKDNVPHQEKKRRKEVLTEILRKTALENNKKYIGQTVKILVESNQRGKTRSFKNVKFESTKDLIGGFVKIKITKATPWGLKGELIK